MNVIGRTARIGFELVALGLLIQLATSLYWSPATFIFSAVCGVPAVLFGGFLVWRGTRPERPGTANPAEPAKGQEGT